MEDTMTVQEGKDADAAACRPPAEWAAYLTTVDSVSRAYAKLTAAYQRQNAAYRIWESARDALVMAEGEV